MKYNHTWTALLLLVLMARPAISVNDNEQEARDNEEEESTLTLSRAEQESAGIVTARVESRALGEEITAPGEVFINSYQSAQVTPRIDAQVVKRHAHLGEQVKQGQPLVTLSSVEMAKAQGDLVVATREWQRVKELGAEVVSARRYVEVQVAQQQAYARVAAFGMTETQISGLLKDSDASKATGDFDLLAPQQGTVIADDFVLGQMVSPGDNVIRDN